MKTILVVDDEQDITDAVSDILEIEGYSVMRAVNGQEALERISQQRPDLILLDMMMPVMDGRETLAALQADEALRGIPVIVASAGDVRDVKARYGVTCMSKPFSIDTLLEQVASKLS